jgi:hypothetical protein
MCRSECSKARTHSSPTLASRCRLSPAICFCAAISKIARAAAGKQIKLVAVFSHARRNRERDDRDRNNRKKQEHRGVTPSGRVTPSNHSEPHLSASSRCQPHRLGVVRAARRPRCGELYYATPLRQRIVRLALRMRTGLQSVPDANCWPRARWGQFFRGRSADATAANWRVCI